MSSIPQPSVETAPRGWLDNFLADARHFQILYLCMFLSYGLLALGWEVELPFFAAAFGGCLGLQALFTWWTGKSWTSLKSALISSLSLCLMLKVNSPWIMLLAAALSISSKFIIKYKGKHIFNPTNFGIVVTMLLTGDAWVSPGQWGSDVTLLYFIGGAAVIVLLRAGRMDTGIAFLGTFVLLEFLRSCVWLGWPVDFLGPKLTSGSLLLFSFFMITDPMASPNHRIARIVWAAAVGALAFYLGNFMQVYTAPIWALFMLSPLVPVFDWVFRAALYQWTPKHVKA